LFAAALLLGTHPAGAALLVYEGFNYAAASGLTNASGASNGNSFGWAARWYGAPNPLSTNFVGSLGYTDLNGNSLATDGGSVVIGNGLTPTAAINAQVTRSFALGITNAAGNTYSGLTNSDGGTTTYWISFTMQWTGYPTDPSVSTSNRYYRKGDLVLRSGSQTNGTSSGTERLNVGRPNANSFPGTPVDTWAFWTNGDAGALLSTVTTTNPLNQPTFVVMRLEVDGSVATLDPAYLWVNWTNLTVTPPLAAASGTNTAQLTGVNNIRLDANNQNASGTNTVLRFDEFRLGTSFIDVAPLSGVEQPPFIFSQPEDHIVTVGDTTSFTVSVASSSTPGYQWYFNTNTPVGNNTNVLVIANAQSGDVGQYFVIITNAGGAATSQVATLTIVPPAPAEIVTDPVSRTEIAGSSTTFSVVAAGTPPLRYQWYFNTNTPLGDQTNATLTLLNLQSNDAGAYSVIVTNNHGADTSAVAILTVIPPFERLPAFPGADGAARYVTGGRGGDVYHVTKLDQSFSNNAPGTLRYGLSSATGPRTIVFDVAGTFWLGRYGTERPEYDSGWDAQSHYYIPDNITLAGQSAPGPVIIMGGVTKPGGYNVILRNITFAAGYGMRTFNEPDRVPPRIPTPGDFPDSFIFPAVEVGGQNVMLDHLTILYASASTVSYRETAANLTVQYSTIAQGQNYPQGDPNVAGGYRGFSYGSVVQSGPNAKISVLNNLHAHFISDLVVVGSEVGPGSFNDCRNNVLYNWLSWASYSAGAGRQCDNNIINQFYLAGPGGDSVSSTNIISAPGQTNIFVGNGTTNTRAYVTGNLKDINQDGDPNDPNSADSDHLQSGLQSTAYDVNIGLTLPAATSFTNVLRHAGARWWVRPYDFTLGNTNDITTNDIAAYVDQRLIKETVTGTGKVMAWADDPFNSSPAEGWEWRALLALRADSNTYSAPFNRPANWDTDGDGMPGAWEIAHGLNPNAANNNADFDTDGYTDLEEYLNDIAAWPAPGVILFNNNTNNRYAEIFNWSVYGVTVNIAGTNTSTYSRWQPSRYDTALISNNTCVVDAVGQHAGKLRLTDNASLNITSGWLSVSNNFENNSGCTVCVLSPGGLRVTNNLVNAGTLLLSGNASLNVGGTFTNTGTLDIMTWNGTLPASFVNLGTVLDRSLITLSSFGVSGTNFIVTIQGYAKHNYQLQYRDDLGSGSWENVDSAIAGANAPINFIHSGGATAVERFYRVLVSP